MTDVSAGFWPPCWCPSRWAPAWRLHTNLYKFGKNVSPHIFRKKNCCDVNLGENLCISTFFLFPDSRLHRLHGFYFIFSSILNGVTLKTSNKETPKIHKRQKEYFSPEVFVYLLLDIAEYISDLWLVWAKFKRSLVFSGRLVFITPTLGHTSHNQSTFIHAQNAGKGFSESRSVDLPSLFWWGISVIE